MFEPKRIAIAFALACSLAACTQPSPGLNAGAGSPAPGDTPLATNPTTGNEVAAVARNKVEVTFRQGGAGLTPGAQRDLDVAARLFRDVKPVRMFIAGYSDGAGDEYSNLILSARRAEMVKRALVARGIPQDRLLLQAYGVSEPLDVQDALAPANRRVVITWRLL